MLILLPLKIELFSFFFFYLFIDSNLVFSVLSWDGGKSNLDREVEKDKERKRHWSDDDYDDEIDTGKVLINNNKSIGRGGGLMATIV